jgi:hypothetical protein
MPIAPATLIKAPATNRVGFNLGISVSCMILCYQYKLSEHRFKFDFFYDADSFCL